MEVSPEDVGPDGAGSPVPRPWWRPPPGALDSAGWALVPLRLFLGVTFLFAGCQKLADPSFFRADSPSSITAQLEGSQRTSPVGGWLGPLVHHGTAVGVVIALGEVAIGLGVLVGLWTRIAATAGLVLSFGLFLTVSFHSSPYFTGSDIVFVFAWTPLLLAGAGGAPSLDVVLAGRRSTAADPAGSADGGSRPVVRRDVVAGLAGGVVLATAGVVAWAGRAVSPSPTGSAAPAAGSATTTVPTPSTTGTAAGGTTGTTAARPAGTRIGSAQDLPPGSAAHFHDPDTGQPGIVIHETAGSFRAFDAVCPHAGCTVGYARAAGLIACPCHGSEFDAETGAVIQGPARHGLSPISVVEGSDGGLYVQG